MSQQIKDRGISHYIDPMKPYGYPLFLHTLGVTTNIPLQEEVAFIQLILHTLTSFLIIFLFKRKYKNIHPFKLLLLFSFIQLNPLLLGSS